MLSCFASKFLTYIPRNRLSRLATTPSNMVAACGRRPGPVDWHYGQRGCRFNGVSRGFDDSLRSRVAGELVTNSSWRGVGLIGEVLTSSLLSTLAHGGQSSHAERAGHAIPRNKPLQEERSDRYGMNRGQVLIECDKRTSAKLRE